MEVFKEVLLAQPSMEESNCVNAEKSEEIKRYLRRSRRRSIETLAHVSGPLGTHGPRPTFLRMETVQSS